MGVTHNPKSNCFYSIKIYYFEYKAVLLDNRAYTLLCTDQSILLFSVHPEMVYFNSGKGRRIFETVLQCHIEDFRSLKRRTRPNDAIPGWTLSNDSEGYGYGNQHIQNNDDKRGW